ncbi:homeobox-leucine zipper protein HAT22 [Corchorus olitorius]|uniref:Homeobox-leucine zipper protein HAT22 n=1 Tax=Corchorus olitorius TaxID=93759 RepID=A0A1R3K411_9ROSI|nr:homeobox-leucine zipper protein HAT22 [Corchorus olitorius]
MGLDDACNTGLVLGLGFSSALETPSSKPKKLTSSASFEPSLTLGLSGESYHQVVNNNTSGSKSKVDVVINGGGYIHHHEETTAVNAAVGGDHLYRQASPHSAVSSFSSGRVKRERDLSYEEVEVEKNNSSRVSDEDEDGVNARKKLRLTKEQSALLEESFKQHSTLNPVSS